MSGRIGWCGRMEVKTFIDSQINPLLLNFTFGELTTNHVVPTNGLLNCGLWRSGIGGVCIPNLMSIDIGIGYDINQISPNDPSYYQKPVISLITVIPESFYTQDLSVSLTKEVASTLETQIVSFFDNCMVELKINEKISMYPRKQMMIHPWSYQLIHGASIALVEHNGNITFEVFYG